MSQMIQTTIFKDENNYCLFDHNQINKFKPEMLSSQYWHEKGAIEGSAQGRGTTWFVKYNEINSNEFKHWVLRHYYRGGLIGKIINDSYLYTSQKKTRAAKEFALLAHMQSLGLPAPRPIAYRVSRFGLFYRADLLSSRIENSKDLVAILSKQKVSDELWKKIGKTIKHFHDHNIYHHDLNAHNILIDEQKAIFLIDFDRCEVNATNQGSWQKNNMARLQRSLLKEAKQLPNFHWNIENWRLLLEGYLSC
jgi:3-deoxy-D-manno-octulosonic acid kinase